MFVDAWMEGKFPAEPPEPAAGPDVPHAAPRSNGDEPLTTRYMLPEFDIDVVIPSGNRRKSERPNAWRATGQIG
jgi:hypothetical protein